MEGGVDAEKPSRQPMVADDHRPIGEPGGDKLPRLLGGGAMPRSRGVGAALNGRRAAACVRYRWLRELVSARDEALIVAETRPRSLTAGGFCRPCRLENPLSSAPDEASNRSLMSLVIPLRNEDRTVPRGRKPQGDQALSNAQRQARYRARLQSRGQLSVAQPAAEADRSAGVLPSANSSRCRLSMPPGSTSGRKACRARPPPKPYARSPISIATNWP